MIPKMKESLQSMPAANPSPAEKPARRSAKHKPVLQAAGGVEDSAADLVTEISFLRGLIENLQREVSELKSERQLDQSGIRLSVESSGAGALQQCPEPDPLEPLRLDEPQEDPTQSSTEPEEPADSGFSPFEPQAFATDFAVAFEAPEPIDWGKWSEPDAGEADLQDQDSWSLDGSSDPALDELVRRHPALIEEVLAFNRVNPPDFEDEPPFHLAVRRADPEGQIGGEGGSEALRLSEAPPPGVHDLMAELVAEASQAPAVSGSADFASPMPEDLSGFAQEEPAQFAQFSGSFFESEDCSYAPAAPDRPLPRRLESEVIERVPAVAAIRACLLPLELAGAELRAGAPKPFDLEAIAEFESQTGLKVQLVLMPLDEVIQGLREGYSTKDEGEFRLRLLSGAAPSVPKTLLERASEFLPFLRRSR